MRVKNKYIQYMNLGILRMEQYFLYRDRRVDVTLKIVCLESTSHMSFIFPG